MSNKNLTDDDVPREIRLSMTAKNIQIPNSETDADDTREDQE